MESTDRCLFCNETAKYIGTGPYRVVCPNCETYYIADNMKDRDQDTLKGYAPYKHIISGVIREKNDMGLRIETIIPENIMSLVNDPLVPKTIGQRLDKILLYYYRRSKIYGQWISVNEKTPPSIGYAVNNEELLNMVQALIDSGLFKLITQGGKMKQFTISLRGISRAEELLSSNVNSYKVFVAMGFKDDLLEAHKMAIQPACRGCGFDASLIIETEHNDDITDKIIAEIKTSKFVITDFTYNNHGAYFEAGYAQGRGLPIIRTCKKEWFDGTDEKGEKNRLHFDINHYNFILWENPEDLKEKLINRIRATIT